MRDKYIDEQFGFWWTAPSTKEGQLFIGCSNTHSRLEFEGPFPAELAERLVREHNRVQSKLVETAEAWARSPPEAFKDYWYNG